MKGAKVGEGDTRWVISRSCVLEKLSGKLGVANKFLFPFNSNYLCSCVGSDGVILLVSFFLIILLLRIL